MDSQSVSNHKVLRLKQVIERIGLGRSTIYDRLNVNSPRYDRSFPKPIKLGSTAVGWVESEITAWIDQCITATYEVVSK